MGGHDGFWRVSRPLTTEVNSKIDLYAGTTGRSIESTSPNPPQRSWRRADPYRARIETEVAAPTASLDPQDKQVTVTKERTRGCGNCRIAARMKRVEGLQPHGCLLGKVLVAVPAQASTSLTLVAGVLMQQGLCCIISCSETISR